jgi:hypothetical protein|tara:strand:+ start:361 stop:636 length:276 start_codon:yes stop_codon:yes gene_type:complete
MSFGGGGNSPLTNHVHDNNPGEGGALSTTLTLMGPDILYSLITDNTTQVATNTANIAALTANIGKWSATNTATFRTSVIAGAQAGVIEEVT